jgi:hypothetical protein
MDGADFDLAIQRAVAEKALADEQARRAAWRRTIENSENFAASSQFGPSETSQLVMLG